MESLSRPPHRRKHSSSSFSLKSPYDDVVLLSNKAKPFDSHEYAEIFAGSSTTSIPVLDLSGLEERAGPEKLDYSNIFGGLRNDDVAVPYQELFSKSGSSSSAKRTKTKQRPPGDPQPPLQESGSPSGKTKSSSGEASDQSIDGAKQQFNLSFNKTSQLNSDVTNGKTHIAQFHAVPGFTYFVDQTPRPQKKEDSRPAPSLKRGVSRTWSFSAEVESLKGKGGLHRPDKSHNVNGVILKSHPSKVPLPSTRPSNPNDNMEYRQSRLPSFSSKEDAPLKTTDEHSPPPLDEDLDENSVAGVSAAALKRAIEQAQESIRIAKMIMERKKENLQDGPKPRSKGRLRVEDKKASMVDRDSYGSKERNVRENYEKLNPVNPTPTGFDGKLSPSLSRSDKGIERGKVDMERVWDNVEAAREHREPLTDGKNIVSSSSRSETHYFAGKAELEKQGGAVEAVREHKEPFVSAGEKITPSRSRSEAPEMVEFEKQGENVESVDAHREVTDFHGLVATAECRAANSVSEQVDNNENLTLSMSNASPREDIGAGKKTLEQGAGTFNLTNIVQLARSTFQKMPTLRKSVTETSQQRQATVDHSQGAENVSDLVEWVFSTSDIPPHQGQNMGEEGAAMRISLEDNVIEKRENAADDKEKHERKFQESEDMDNWEYAREPRSEFSTSIHESQNLIEIDVLDQENTMKNSESVPEQREHDQSDGKRYEEKENGMKQIEAHQGFESEKQLEEDLEEQTTKSKLEVSPETGEVEGGATDTYDPEIDEKKLSDAHDEDGVNLPGEFQQIEERSADTFEYEAAEFIEMEANNCAELHQDEEIQDTEEANHSLGGAKNGEQKQNKCDFLEAAHEEDNDFDSSGTAYAGAVFSDAHNSDTSTLYDETQEAHDVNRAEEHQKVFKSFKENIGGVPETFSTIDKDEAAEQLFHLGDIKTPETDCLRRTVSEENFVGSKLHDASSNGRKENVGFMDADFEELRKDQDTFTTDGIHDDAMGSRPNLPEIHPSDNKIADLDLTCVRQVSEQTTENQGGSVSTSSIENIDWMLAHECEGAEEKANGESLNKGEVKDDHETTFSEIKCTKERERGEVVYYEEQSVGVNSEEQSEGVDPDEPSEGVDSEEQSEGIDSEKQSEGVDSEERSEGINYEDKIEVNSEEQREELHYQPHSEPTEMDKSMETKRSVETSQNIEKAKEDVTGISTKVKKDAKESTDNFNKDEQQQRIEAIKRGREREKDRLVVERAIREARERAFAEARERAERAAVERAAAEARQRAMTEAREKLEKASTEAKIRAERAAVERATSEARERAREKAMSQKASTDARTPTDRINTERLSSSSRDNILKHSFSSSELEKFSEANTESAQRRNLILERHQRIMERAAKALAEKNMRDLVAQKEQAERNRLAESLDADIKRWAMGKEGNLRALLSTLQYILGPDSGWQPISLTEIITTAAVKKAYRKATLYVHPDKLQQRGASIKQKYICEKIFDLLKAAWNRFNSEER